MHENNLKCHFLETNHTCSSLFREEKEGGGVTINLTTCTSQGRRSHLLTKNIKEGPGDFTFMLIGILLVHPPSKK